MEEGRISATDSTPTTIACNFRSSTTGPKASSSDRTIYGRRAAKEGLSMSTSKARSKYILIATLVTSSLVSIGASAQASRSPVAPRRELVEAVVKEAYEKFKNDANGKNADYIPYLAQVDSKLFGIAIVTTDNQVLTMGDVTYSFSIQSISKVYSLALAMEEQGPGKVLEKIGSEPTGRPFNSPNAVVDMSTHSGNPFVNAGAIATVSLISGSTADQKWNKILDFYSKAAGEKLVLIAGVS